MLASCHAMVTQILLEHAFLTTSLSSIAAINDDRLSCNALSILPG